MYKVLIVDDEPIFRMGLRTSVAWESINCMVIGEAKNGQEALARIVEQKPDIVLLDIKMPLLGGIEVLKELKQMQIKTHCIMLSCFNEYEYMREAIKLGASDYLFKPLMEAKDILGSVSEVIKEMEQHQEQNFGDDLWEKKQETFRDYLFIKQGNAKNDRKREELLTKLYEGITVPEGGIFLFLSIHLSESDENVAEVKDSIFVNIVKSEIGSSTVPLFLRQKSNLFVVLSMKLERLDFVEQIVKGIADTMSFYTGNPVYIGYSETSASLSELYMLYEHAKKAQEMHYFSSCRKSTKNCIGWKESYAEEYEYITMYEKELQLLGKAYEKADMDQIEAILKMVRDHILISKKYDRNAFEHMLAKSLIDYVKRNAQRGSLEQILLRDYEFISRLYQQQTIDAGIACFVSNVRAIYDWKQEQSKEKKSMMDPVLSYIDMHFREAISLSEMAGQIGVSSNYFSKLFKEEVGETFIEYLIKKRIHEAEYLLGQGDERTYEIAYQSGFSDYHHFCKTFKKYTGKTPKEYRKMKMEVTMNS